MSLSGDVAVNFWLNLDEGYKSSDNYILFTVNGQTQKVTVGKAANGTNGAKIFACGVAAKEMTDTISAQFYLVDGTAVGSPYTYTVRDYADYILTHDSYSKEAKNLVKAMLNYGACSQKYFKYRTDDLANSEISLKLYFKDVDMEGMEFKQYFYPITVTKQGGYTIVTIENISALWINSGVRVDVWKDGSYYDYVEYCPERYCKLILNQPTSEVYNVDLKRVVSSLYLYNLAAHEYAAKANQI